MRTIYTHITKQILATSLMTVTVFTFVLVLGNVLKEIVALLVNGEASLGLVFRALGLLLPYVLVFALPIGLLTAVLLFFGRFSADQELTALRSSGVSVINLALPVLLLSLVCSGLCAVINLWAGPICRATYKNLLNTVDVRTTASLLPEGTFITEVPGYWLYIGEREGDQLREVRIFTLSDGEADAEYNAARGRLEFNEQEGLVQFVLENTTAMLRREKKNALNQEYEWQWLEIPGEYISEPIQLEKQQQRRTKPKISNMTLKQLQTELLIREAAVEDSKLRSRGAIQGEDVAMNRVEMLTPVKLQIHRQIAFSFACFSFTLIGIPLGIQAHRRETTMGIALALILLAVYYTFLIVAQSLDTKPQFYPEIIVWLPNFLFQGIGSFLLWRANRGL